MKLEIELDGEVEHHFEYLLGEAVVDEDGEERPAEPEELAERLIADAAFSRYIEVLQNGE